MAKGLFRRAVEALEAIAIAESDNCRLLQQAVVQNGDIWAAQKEVRDRTRLLLDQMETVPNRMDILETDLRDHCALQRHSRRKNAAEVQPELAEAASGEAGQ